MSATASKTTILVILLLSCLPSLPSAAQTTKPNIVLIMADDVSWECFGCYGSDEYHTPRIDELASEGTRMAHCYSTPLCTPSRVEIMTGKYNFRNYTHFGYLAPSENTFGHMLQQAGYQTAIAGKWQLNGVYDQFPGFDDPTRPQQAGFHESMLWQVTRRRGGKRGEGERYWTPLIEHNGKTVPYHEVEGKYGPDLFTDFICDFIKRQREKPFFVYYPMVLVHDPFVPTPDTITTIPSSATNIQPKDADEKKEHFVAMVNYMDKLVGRIVDTIDSQGLGSNTLIIFTADNGTHRTIRSEWQGQAIQGGKGSMTNMGTHVPMVARWTGELPPGTVSERLVDFTDVFPTLAQVSGVIPLETSMLDGMSFLPSLRGEAGTLRPWVLCHYHPYWGGKQHGTFVRNARYKLYGDGRFVDVSRDLNEKVEVATDVDGDSDTLRDEFAAVLAMTPPVPPTARPRREIPRPTYPARPRLLGSPVWDNTDAQLNATSTSTTTPQ